MAESNSDNPEELKPTPWEIALDKLLPGKDWNKVRGQLSKLHPETLSKDLLITLRKLYTREDVVDSFEQLREQTKQDILNVLQAGIETFAQLQQENRSCYKRCTVKERRLRSCGT
jgi:hypothetical protein